MSDSEKQALIDEALHSHDGQVAIAKACGEAHARTHGEQAGKEREKEVLSLLRLSASYDALLKKM